MSTEDLGPEEALAELCRQVDDKRALMGLTRAQLATNAGVSRSTVNNVFNGLMPKADTIGLLADALRLDGQTLLDLRRIAVGEAEGAARAERRPRDAATEVLVPAEDLAIATKLQQVVEEVARSSAAAAPGSATNIILGGTQNGPVITGHTISGFSFTTQLPPPTPEPGVESAEHGAQSGEQGR
ncbi:helix-turn-helix transcriptional regulator [Streptomyces sp. NPDC091204]|uniref:helix-turn-helix domain-containing protein n=1 Tax=Streptomyces sp. NPDC091204 TaxID=3155299 RepID=UPI0034120C43